MSGRTLKSALKSKSNLGKTVKVDLAANTVGETYPKFNRRGDKTRKLHLRSYKLPNARLNAYKDKLLMRDMGGLTDEALAVMEAREDRLEMKRRKRFEDAMTRHTGPDADASVPPEPDLPESEGGRRKRRRKTRRHRR